MIILLLAVLYLSDCLWLAPWNSVAIERLFFDRGWRVRAPSDWAGTVRSSLIALVPLPGGTAVQLNAPPISLSPSGLAAWTPFAWSDRGRPAQPGNALPWSEVGEISTNDADLLVNGGLLHRFPSRSEAARWMELAISVRDACPDERDRILRDYWASRIDPAGLRDRLESIWRAVRPLRWAGSVQWIVMFVVAPTVLSRYGGPLILLALAGSIFGLAAINAVFFARVHRQLCPDERVKRAESTILMLLSWPMAARASDIAARHALARFDPTAALLAMPDVEASRSLFHRVIRDARHPLAAEELDPLTRDTSDRFASLWLDRVLRSAKELGLQIPDRAEGAGVGNHTGLHCPRCLSTYEHDASTCNDCPGVRLEPTGTTEGA